METYGTLALSVAIIAGQLSSIPGGCPAPEALGAELVRMAREDQTARLEWQSDFTARERIDRQNTERMKAIVANCGWPTISMVGEAAAQSAWLLVQHASLDRPFQREVLVMMGELVPLHELDPSWYAHLWDQLHDPQRYGTQGACVSGTRFVPRPMEDASRIDELREEVGLPPLAEYVQSASALSAVHALEP